MYARRQTGKTQYEGRSRKIWSGKTVNSFLNHYMPDDTNILGMPLGSMIYVKNMEYLRTGNSNQLRTRRGSSLIKDIIKEPVGAGNFVNGSSEYPVWVDIDGNLKYFNSNTDAITTITTGLNTGNHQMQSFNAPSGAVLYGCNGDSNLYKIDASFSHSVVLNTPIEAWAFSNISGRGVGVIGHVVYYSNIQLQDALDTTNLETYDTTDQRLVISPGVGEKIYTVKDNGEITFFFKDVGIWAWINADQADTAWLFPQCAIDTGTRSPHSVVYARFREQNGYIFLGSDKTLRFFNGSVERNSGSKPTLKGGGSLILSDPFQKLLDDIPDGRLGSVVAGYIDNYYILSFSSTGSSVNDMAIMIDLEKIDKDKKPYWFYLENWNFNFFTSLKSGNLYGWSIQGYIADLLKDNQFYDEVPDRVSFYSDDSTDGTTRQIAVRFSGYIYWHRVNRNESRLYDCSVGWKAEGRWALNFVVNTYTINDSVPYYSNGATVQLYPQLAGGSYFDYDYFNRAYFSDSSGTVMQSAGEPGEGHFFLFGFYSDNINEYATVYSIETQYQTLFKSPVSKNK
jgi:hypothetical protein